MAQRKKICNYYMNVSVLLFLPPCLSRSLQPKADSALTKRLHKSLSCAARKARFAHLSNAARRTEGHALIFSCTSLFNPNSCHHKVGTAVSSFSTRIVSCSRIEVGERFPDWFVTLGGYRKSKRCVLGNCLRYLQYALCCYGFHSTFRTKVGTTRICNVIHN